MLPRRNPIVIKEERIEEEDLTIIGSDDDEITELEHLRKLFVGGLASYTTEDSLRSFFGQWGKVVDCVVMRDSVTKKSRGFGFITYTKASMVDKAQKARPHTIDGKNVESKRALQRPERQNRETNASVKKIFIGGLKDNHDEECLREHFSQFGDVVSVKILTDKSTGKRRGFAFVEFDDYDSVDKAILQKSHSIKYVLVDVKKSVYNKEKGNPGMPSTTDVTRKQGQPQNNSYNSRLPMNGRHMNGPHMNGPHMNGPPMNGPPMNGPYMNGPHMNGPHMNGPPMNAQPMHRPPMNGPPINGPPMNGPPMNGPPMNGPPMNGPPMNGPPINGAPMQGPINGPPQPPANFNSWGPPNNYNTYNQPPMNNWNWNQPFQNGWNGPPYGQWNQGNYGAPPQTNWNGGPVPPQANWNAGPTAPQGNWNTLQPQSQVPPQPQPPQQPQGLPPAQGPTPLQQQGSAQLQQQGTPQQKQGLQQQQQRPQQQQQQGLPQQQQGPPQQQQGPPQQQQGPPQQQQQGPPQQQQVAPIQQQQGPPQQQQGPTQYQGSQQNFGSGYQQNYGGGPQRSNLNNNIRKNPYAAAPGVSSISRQQQPVPPGVSNRRF